MRVLDVLTRERVTLAGEVPGGIRSKADALAHLGRLLAGGAAGLDGGDVERVLNERERLQSTGVGGGVAIPHGALNHLDRLIGAVLLCRPPIPFDAIDGEPVSILFAVIGPKRATGEHLKTLARVSRLLRDDAFRERLLASPSGLAAYQLIATEESKPGAL
jgi:PTS system nitrogen regulatory IIA component